MKILRLKAVKEMTGLGRSSIYSYMASNTFPKSIKLGPRSVGWVEENILNWIQVRQQKLADAPFPPS